MPGLCFPSLICGRGHLLQVYCVPVSWNSHAIPVSNATLPCASSLWSAYCTRWWCSLWNTLRSVSCQSSPWPSFPLEKSSSPPGDGNGPFCHYYHPVHGKICRWNPQMASILLNAHPPVTVTLQAIPLITKLLFLPWATFMCNLSLFIPPPFFLHFAFMHFSLFHFFKLLNMLGMINYFLIDIRGIEPSYIFPMVIWGCTNTLHARYCVKNFM